MSVDGIHASPPPAAAEVAVPARAPDAVQLNAVHSMCRTAWAHTQAVVRALRTYSLFDEAVAGDQAVADLRAAQELIAGVGTWAKRCAEAAGGEGSR